MSATMEELDLQVEEDVTTIVVVEDHALVRESIVRALVGDGHEVIADCAGPEEALRIIAVRRPDVVLVDVNLSDPTDGVELAAQVARRSPDTRVMVVSMHDDERTVRRALQAGVAGFFSKDEPLDELLTAVRTIARGGSFLSSRLASSVMAMMGAARKAPDHLTDREHEVLQLLAAGERTADIADALFLSEKTVKNHLTGVYAKLGVSSAAQAVAEAYHRGLVQRA